MINDQTKLELVLNHLEPSEVSYFTKQNNTLEKTLLEASYTLPALDYEINPFVKMVDKEKTIWIPDISSR